MSGAHATLGASSAYRWSRCSGSPRLIGALDPRDRREGSAYAAEGSAAHFLAEQCLTTWFGRPKPERRVAADFIGRIIRATDDGHVFVEGEPATGDWPVTEEMAEAVQVYLDTIQAEIAARPGATVYIEERVKPLPDRDDMFGTADLILWDFIESLLVVTDYKHGAGVLVEVEHNLQAMYYALGAIRKLGLTAEEVPEVELVIVQPRGRHSDGAVRRWRISTRELIEWGGTLRSAAEATEAEHAPLRAGDWCRFCPAAGACPELRRETFGRAQIVFADPVPAPSERKLQLPNPADPEQVAKALAFVPIIDAWCREVEGLAQRILERGGRVPGFKLVRKRANRRWRDEKALAEALDKKGVPRDLYLTTPEIKSPAQLEKLAALGKPKERTEFVAEFAEKPEGGLTIADASDSREEVAPPVLTVFADPPKLGESSGSGQAESGSPEQQGTSTLFD